MRIQKTQQSRLADTDFDNLPFGRTFSDHMYICDYRDGQWGEGQIVPFGHFTMHPASLVLHYGQSVFEGMKASKMQDGRPALMRPIEHARRLNRSAHRLMMPAFPEDRFLEAVRELVALDADWIPPQEGSALYIRPFLFATDEFIGVRPSDSYRFIIFTGPTGPYYAKPVSLWVEQKYVRAVPGGTGEAKAAGNYAGSLLPAHEAMERGFDQVMWMGGARMNEVQEVGTMNIFFVIDNEVITPATDGAILKGITRDSFLKILQHEGYQVSERKIEIEEVLQAHREGRLKECFGSGTAAVVSHVSQIQFGDETMDLPPVEDRKVANFLKDYIDGLRSGRIEDCFGWIEVVHPARVPA